MPTSLDGVTVRIDGKPAVLSYISPAELKVLAPEEVKLGTPLKLDVEAPSGKYEVTVQFRRLAPGLFMYEPQYRKYVSAQHSSGFTPAAKAGLVEGATPAKAGELIVVYGTGFGPGNPPAQPGRALPKPVPLAHSVKAWVGGKPAEVKWAGLSSVGLDQFNIVVPSGVEPGDARIELEVEGERTQNNAWLTVAK